jgi:hypothetical protein
MTSPTPLQPKTADPAELWERYLAEAGMLSPQGAMAFAADFYLTRIERLETAIKGAAAAANISGSLLKEKDEQIASLKARIEELEERCEATETANTDVSNEGLVHLNRALIAEARIEELEGALRFYADGRRYQGANQQPIPDDPYAKPDAVYIQDVTRDCGAIARAVLQSGGAE